MTKIHWFVEDIYYGQTDYIPRRFTSGFVRHKPYHKLAIACRECGNIWARVYSDESKGPWLFVTGLDCRRCGGGILTYPPYVLEELIEAIPFKLLEREFLIEAEKELLNET